MKIMMKLITNIFRFFFIFVIKFSIIIRMQIIIVLDECEHNDIYFYIYVRRVKPARL